MAFYIETQGSDKNEESCVESMMRLCVRLNSRGV